MCHTNPDLQSDSDRLKEHLAATQRPPSPTTTTTTTTVSPPHLLPSLAPLSSSFSLCCHFVSASFLHLLHSIPLIFLFYSASSLSPLIFSERLLDSIFSKFVPSLLLFLFLVITLLHSFERDVSLKSLKTQFLLPCLPLPSQSPLFPACFFLSLCVTLLVDFCFSSPLPLSTNEFWALCSYRWCSSQPLAAGPQLDKRERQRERKTDRAVQHQTVCHHLLSKVDRNQHIGECDLT